MLVTFVGGVSGRWQVIDVVGVRGEALPLVERLAVYEAAEQQPTSPGGGSSSAWSLRGVVSHQRYTTLTEQHELGARSPALGRPEATRAALIPIRKTPQWWGLAQDERRALFEERSGHLSMSMGYLPAVARRLHHSRDLGEPTS